jgi:hypothetical protein
LDSKVLWGNAQFQFFFYINFDTHFWIYIFCQFACIAFSKIEQIQERCRLTL